MTKRLEWWVIGVALIPSPMLVLTLDVRILWFLRGFEESKFLVIPFIFNLPNLHFNFFTYVLLELLKIFLYFEWNEDSWEISWISLES